MSFEFDVFYKQDAVASLPCVILLSQEHDESLGLSAESPIHQVGSLTSHHVARYERILLIIVLNSRLAFR
ncbi:MAG: hypothetical protein ACKVGW_05415 [Verrucomicrobiia bacterium]|jgi:hypothetical protein